MELSVLKTVLQAIHRTLKSTSFTENKYAMTSNYAILNTKTEDNRKLENLMLRQIEEFSRSKTKTAKTPKEHCLRNKSTMKIKGIMSMLSKMESITQQLKDNKSAVQELKALQIDILAAQLKIKTNPFLKVKDLETTYDGLLTRANNQMSTLQQQLKDQKKAEEQERLRKIQEEMEKEKLKKAQEEQIKKELEENQKKKAEIEKCRKMEEERLRQLEELAKRDFEILKAEQQKEETRLREQLEQERRDHELALRLANECNSQVEDFSSSNKLYQNHSQTNKKHDLSKWKYSELRDTINTSCDIELLEACRHEFHRRLEMYDAWKAKNNKKTSVEENERAPKAIMDAGVDDMQMCELSLEKTGLARMKDAEISENEFDKEWWKHYVRPSERAILHEEWKAPILHEASGMSKGDFGFVIAKEINNEVTQNERAPKAIMDEAIRASTINNFTIAVNNPQRYFRIPFVRSYLGKNPSEGLGKGVFINQANGSKGFWYAHFDGQHIARQMELFPDEPAILLLAGVHDKKMCLLKLEETSLSKRKDAEILENEFDKEWLKHGGKPYVRLSERQKIEHLLKYLKLQF